MHIKTSDFSAFPNLHTCYISVTHTVRNYFFTVTIREISYMNWYVPNRDTDGRCFNPSFLVVIWTFFLARVRLWDRFTLVCCNLTAVQMHAWFQCVLPSFLATVILTSIWVCIFAAFSESTPNIWHAGLSENAAKTHDLIEVNGTTAYNAGKMHGNHTYALTVAKLKHTSVNLAFSIE